MIAGAFPEERDGLPGRPVLSAATLGPRLQEQHPVHEGQHLPEALLLNCAPRAEFQAAQHVGTGLAA